MTALVQDLRNTIGGQVVNHHGDAQLLIDGDRIYANALGKIRIDHKGRIHDVGTCASTVDDIAAAVARVRGVA